MHWLDIVILTIILFFFLIGISRGLIRQIFSLAAIAGGIVCGLIFYDVAGKFLMDKNLVQTASSSLLIGFILVVILSFIVIQILGWFASRVIGKLRLGWLNRLAGGVVGILIGIVVTFFLVTWLNLSVLKSNSELNKSVLFPYVEGSYELLEFSIPDQLRQGYETAQKKFQEEGEKALIHIKEADKPQKVGPRK